jgi:carbamoyl-phosphate synthase large subunit
MHAGEVMGIDMTFEKAYAKAAVAAGNRLPEPGSGVFISVRNEDKEAIIPVAQGLHNLGYKILATIGTGAAIKAANVPCETIYKINEGRPNASTLPLLQLALDYLALIASCLRLVHARM